MAVIVAAVAGIRTMSSDHGEPRIDTKGRMTIPRPVRDRLNLTAGNQVDIEVGTVVIKP
ncbi:AbrB/MazE/SpoVT family DNA-binding domain-containing protein [Haloarchaeobius amylolyticus]|uniref:AbrB/MazE/SpoVT family DNA-binding domain-containing protein n=1 Tax=Haloarchaeobius amylolyticus TaxID=1198296 RepID=UPI00226E9713|nr:AbrB/MazE/SpoVT family DNA-binding domain-containing protein [Haloarchaeobius amylolyticus]